MALTAPDWKRIVPFDGDRRRAMLEALAELPTGPVWDVTIGHDADCPALEWGYLADCTCDTVTLEARQLR
jgi:hypothetical protein